MPDDSANDNLRLLYILAHPDDEALALGGLLAKSAAEGVETYLVTATRGQMGWFGPPDENPGPEELGRIREGELRAAAKVFGLREVTLLDYMDGELDKADQVRLTRQFVGEIRRIRPHVVVAFDQFGVYGHPDHIAATRAATAAVAAAADATYEDSEGRAPHAVSKLYYYAFRKVVQEAFEVAFGELVMNIEGVERRSVTWPEWAITTWIDTSAYWETVWEGIRCHRTQLPGYQKLLDLSEEYHQSLWGTVTLCRVFSLVPTPLHEDDVFAGLR